MGRRTLVALGVVVAVAAVVGVVGLRTPSVRPPSEVVSTETAPIGTSPSAAVAPPEEVVVDKATATAADRAKLVVLDEVLASRNDNDPRLDLVFRDLTPGAKHLLRERYRSLPRESFNERGTVVLLLARELRTPADVKFVGEVLRETPCRGMRDCAKEDPPETEHVAVNASTLAYPQLVALAQMQRYFDRRDRDPAVVAALVQELREARTSTTARIAEYARRVRMPSGE